MVAIDVKCPNCGQTITIDRPIKASSWYRCYVCNASWGVRELLKQFDLQLLEQESSQKVEITTDIPKISKELHEKKDPDKYIPRPSLEKLDPLTLEPIPKEKKESSVWDFGDSESGIVYSYVDESGWLIYVLEDSESGLLLHKKIRKVLKNE